MLNLNSLIGQEIDSTKFSVSIDLAKLPTTFNLIKEESTNTYKNDICIRYRLNKTFFLSSNAGVFNTDRESSKYHYRSISKGVYLLFGPGLSLKLDEMTNLALGYNLGVSFYDISDKAKFTSDFWQENLEAEFFIDKGTKTFHELYTGFTTEFFRLGKTIWYIEPAGRLRLGLSNVNSTDNRNRYPGYGSYNSEYKFMVAFTCHAGIKF